jgi:cystathionine beta-lyase
MFGEEGMKNGDFYFDEYIDRKGSGAVKWDDPGRDEGQAELIPLWVADMDFSSPPEVVKALQARAAHPVYGYTGAADGYLETLRDWYRDHYHVPSDTGDFLIGPGTVPSLGIAVRGFTSPGDGVLIFTPVYHPFFDMIRRNGRKTVEAPMVLNEQGRYGFSREAAEQALDAARDRGIRVPLALFCSPHNPGGSVWEKRELEDLLRFTAERNIITAADEIHGDFVFPPKTFTSLGAFPEYADRIVVISGANKSFNLGGLHVSHFLVRDEKLKTVLSAGLRALAFHHGDIFSMLAAETAYRTGAPWLAALKTYLRDNIEEGVRGINAEVPGVRAYVPEGTYLIWADASGLIARLSLRDDAELVLRLEREGRVKFTPGSAFGREGQGFLRINAACPRSQLLEGIDRLKTWAKA